MRSVCQRSSSVEGCLPSKVVFRQRSTSVKGRLPSKVVFCQMSSSIKGHLPLKVVFRQRLSSKKVVFHQRASSIKVCLPSKFVFHQSLSSILTRCGSESSNYKLGRLDKNAAKWSVQRSRNKVWHHGSKSHNLSLLTPLWLS